MYRYRWIDPGTPRETGNPVTDSCNYSAFLTPIGYRHLEKSLLNQIWFNLGDSHANQEKDDQAPRLEPRGRQGIQVPRQGEDARRKNCPQVQENRGSDPPEGASSRRLPEFARRLNQPPRVYTGETPGNRSPSRAERGDAD
jgi:hypothetical protein